ncbi:MAG: UvrD-helicase domain-containing protein, partial [Muribaculaceae bacterium]|nr:UvrD-helicase domain-containing protein [Muribaculaceae bacterium]
MLQLQRASAGSGKTYTLAKKYIWFLITVSRPDGKRRLRNPREIADELPRILAITFTNKATNEMKQ